MSIAGKKRENAANIVHRINCSTVSEMSDSFSETATSKSSRQKAPLRIATVLILSTLSRHFVCKSVLEDSAFSFKNIALSNVSKEKERGLISFDKLSV